MIVRAQTLLPSVSMPHCFIAAVSSYISLGNSDKCAIRQGRPWPHSRSKNLRRNALSTDLELGLRVSDSEETIYLTPSRNKPGSSPLIAVPEDYSTGLYRLLVRTDRNNGLSKECWMWYCNYLNDTIKQDWPKILSPSIVGLDPDFPREPTVWKQQLAIVYKVLETIASAISHRGDVSLDQVIEALSTNRLLHAEDPEQLSLDQKANRQMVWCLSGTITMLHEPQRAPFSEMLHLRQPAFSSRARGIRRRRDISSSQQDIKNCSDPLHSLLAQFGDLIPRIEVDAEDAPSMDQDYINIAYINFYTLKHVAKLEIEWVNTMNLHLQLDKRKRTLRLYRFPALCHLLWTDTENSFMQNLFADYCKSQVSGLDPTEHTFSDYLREIILTFRLIFGIEKKARHEFIKTELNNWRRGDRTSEGPTPTSSQTSSQARRPPSRLRSIFRGSTNQGPADEVSLPHPYLAEDPLLAILSTIDMPHTSHAGLSPKQKSLHRLLTRLHGEEKSDHYDLEDFPFLGRRLAELQRYSRVQTPKNWWSVFWQDRRDISGWWNGLITYMLFLIGGATIVLQALQLAFQVWGTLLQKKQG